MLISGGKKNIRAVIFDLGRVLVTVDFGRLRHKMEAQHLADPEVFTMERITRLPFFKPLMEGRITPREFLIRFNSHFGVQWTFDTFSEVWCDIFGEEPGMRTFLEKIMSRYPVTLLSDVDPLHWNYLIRTYPWLTAIPRPVLSFQSGYMKPDPNCYIKAAEAVATPPEHCLFIDDRPPNVAGACAAGMQAVLFKGVELLSRALPLFSWENGPIYP